MCIVTRTFALVVFVTCKIAFLIQIPYPIHIHRSLSGLVSITKIKICLRLFFQGVAFDLLSAHQIHFQLFFEVKKRGKFPNA